MSAIFDRAPRLAEKNLFIKDPIRLSENFDTSATEFLKVARDLELEGIIAKRKNSIYIPGLRTKDWLKMKTGKRQEVVIGVYTINEGTSKPFSALLVGVYEGNNVIYTGKVGTGFNTTVQKDLLKRFQKIIRQKNPFSILPDVNAPSRFRPNAPKAKVFWLKPKLIAEVNYTELTSDGIMRHPSFKGLREDKEAQKVVLEKASPVKKKKAAKKTKRANNKILKRIKKERRTLLNPTDKTQVKTIQRHELTFNNLNKIYWPDENITKREVLNYYYQATPFILPYLLDRPQSMNRHPNGIKGKSFYQKDVTGKAPDWVETMLYHSEGDEKDKHF